MRSPKDKIFDGMNILVLLFLSFITLYPFWNVAVISFNNALDSIRGGIYFWPREFTWNNYIVLFENQAIPHAAMVSVLRTLISVVAGVFVTAMVAYTISRREYIFRKLVTTAFVLTMYFSGGLIPTYFLIRELGMINSFSVYIIPGLIGAFNLIIIRTFIEGLPEGIIESAKIDGAGDFNVFMRVVFPLCMPVIATVSLFIAVGEWNDWFTTYLYNSSNANLSTLQYELMKVLQSANASMSSSGSLATRLANPNEEAAVTPNSIRAAMTIVASLPIMLVYPFLQKYFVKGVMIGGVKE